MRDQLRDLIAAKMRAADRGCTDPRPPDRGDDAAYYRRRADSVMELFPEVRQHWQDAVGSWTSSPLPFADATRFVATTAAIATTRDPS